MADKNGAKKMKEAMVVPINMVRVDEKWRPRLSAADVSQELLTSIGGAGIIRPLDVRNKPGTKSYWVIDGEHRLKAAKMLKLKSVPIILHEVDDDEEALIIALASAHQKPFTEGEVRKSIVRLHNNGVSNEDIVAYTGYGIRKVREAIRISEQASARLAEANIDSRVAARAANLPEKVQDELAFKLESTGRSEGLDIVRKAEKEYTDRAAPGPKVKAISTYPLVKNPKVVLEDMEKWIKAEIKSNPTNLVRKAQLDVVKVMKGVIELDSFKTR